MLDLPAVAKISVAVLGAGALGGYLGGKLAVAGQGDGVTLVGRPRVVNAVNANGLVLQESMERSVARPLAVSSDEALPTFDLVILAVRTFDVESAIPQLEQLIGSTGRVLAMQNGVGSEELLAERLGRERVIAGALTVSVVMDEPGVITRTSRGGGLTVASLTQDAVPGWIVQMLHTTGLSVQEVTDYRSLRWSKLLLNMLGAAGSALLDIDLAQLVANPALMRLEQLALREAGTVMDAQGIATIDLPGYRVRAARTIMRLQPPLPRLLLGRRLVKARSGRSPGTRADMARGRSEIGWYHGAVFAAAAKSGVAAPANGSVAALAHELVASPDLRAQYRGNTAALISYLRDRGVRLD